MVGKKTEKQRIKRSIVKLQEMMQRNRHRPLKEQLEKINQTLRGHYAYYGIAGNLESLNKIYRAAERYWRKMLNSRNRDNDVTWDKFREIKLIFPILRPKLQISYRQLKSYAML